MRHHPEMLAEWYGIHARPLPWRSTKDPYRIWVSEVILQQTRVSQGISYYDRFLGRFPDIAALAGAPLDEVLHAWEGLGYYRRAVNMHRAASVVVASCGGIFPSGYETLKKLPGIGDYTAAAIASICSGEPKPAIDGNVRRFLSRLYNLSLNPASAADNRELKQAASGFLPGRDPGMMNQAMIEFGALQCIPANPDCIACPFDDCRALAAGTVQLLPVKSSRKAVRRRHLHYFVFTWTEGSSTCFLVHKRGDDDIWALMYDFPCAETDTAAETEERLRQHAGQWCDMPAAIPLENTSRPYLHKLTHQDLVADFFVVRLEAPPAWHHPSLLRLTSHELKKLARPRLISRFLDDSFPGL